MRLGSDDLRCCSIDSSAGAVGACSSLFFGSYELRRFEDFLGPLAPCGGSLGFPTALGPTTEALDCLRPREAVVVSTGCFFCFTCFVVWHG